MRQSEGMCSLPCAAMLLLLAALGGCAGLGERREEPAEISNPVGEAVDSGAARSGTSTSSGTRQPPGDPVPPAQAPQDGPPGHAGSSLMLAALQARSAGDSSRAIALLERAQRIDPDNGELYLELARTHFAAGNAAQGRATAERGLLYCQRAECAALRDLIR